MSLHVSEIGRERIWREKRAGLIPAVYRVPVWHCWWVRLLRRVRSVLTLISAQAVQA